MWGMPLARNDFHAQAASEVHAGPADNIGRAHKKRRSRQGAKNAKKSVLVFLCVLCSLRESLLSLQARGRTEGRVGGGVASAASHRSGRAQLRHPVRLVMASLSRFAIHERCVDP